MAEAEAKEEAINEKTADIASEKKKSKEESCDKTKSSVILTKELVKEEWPKILEMIKNKKMSVASYLIEGEIIEVNPVRDIKGTTSETKISNGVNSSVITLGFAKKFNFHKETLESAHNRRFVEEIASDVFRQKIQLKFLTLENPETPLSKMDNPSKFNTEMDLEYEEKKDAFDEPLIQSAIEMFNGKIIDRKERPTRRPIFRNSNNNKKDLGGREGSNK